MSVRSITSLAVERDRAQPGSKAPSSSKKKSGEKPETSLGEALTSAIPTETLALYTGAIGLVTALPGAGATGYIPFRWWAYALFVPVPLLFVVFSYRYKKDAGDRSRPVPTLEATTATVAAAVWGLAMPGSALNLSLSGDVKTITIGLITLLGAAVVAGFSGLLPRATNK